MMRRLRGIIALIPCLLALSFQAAQADQLVEVYLESPLLPGYTDLSFKFNSQTYAPNSVYIGAFNTSLVSANGQPTFDSYCIDLYHDFSGPPTNWSAEPLANWNQGSQSDSSNPGMLNVGGALGYLVSQYDPIVAGFNTPGVGFNQGQANLYAAALQVALWAVEYNGTSASLNDPAQLFQFDDGPANSDQDNVYQLAKTMISSIGSNTAAASFFLSQRDNPSQDLIAGAGNSPLVTIPEPCSVGLIAVGLGLVVFRARRIPRNA